MNGESDESATQASLPFPSDGLLFLVRGGAPVESPQGMVYSCSPEVWHDDRGILHVTKGPEVSIVAAEYVAYTLARRVGVAVPDHALAVHPKRQGLMFASRLVEDAMRDASFLTQRPLSSQQETQLSLILLVDVWLANKDRNIGNLLVRSAPGNGRAMELVAIDFEKSVVLSDPYPLITCSSLKASELWPRGTLGSHLRGLPRPDSLVASVTSLPDDFIAATLVEARERIGPKFSWYDDSRVALCRRRDRLEALVEEVWSCHR